MYNLGNNSISKGILKALHESENLNEANVDHYEKCSVCGADVVFYDDNTTDAAFGPNGAVYCENCAAEEGLLELSDRLNEDESNASEKEMNIYSNKPRLEQKKYIYKVLKDDIPLDNPNETDVEVAEKECAHVDLHDKDKAATEIVKKLYKVKKDNQVGTTTFTESASDCIADTSQRTMIPKNQEKEPEYMVEDVTDMEEIVPGDVKPPRPIEDVQEILVKVDNRFKKNINESWGQMNIITTSNPQSRKYSSATLSLIRPDNKSYLFSVELNEEENNLYEFTVRNQLGKVEYTKKTYNPVHIAERYIKSLLD